MSWLSQALKRTMGIPEIDLLKIDFVRVIVARNAADLLKKDIERLPDDVFMSVFEVVWDEAHKRDIKLEDTRETLADFIVSGKA